MSGTGDNALLELFREEVRTNVQTLEGGLVLLEQDLENLQQIEPLMRAAHSVKGAARVVNIDAAVTLAHAAEDCLVAAQEARITLTADDIDTLLSAADLLGGIAEAAGPNLPQWLAQSGAEIESLAAALQQRAQGHTASGTTPPTPALAPNTRTHASVAPSAPTLKAAIDHDASQTFQASPLVDLFRAETETNAATLQEALNTIDPHKLDTETCEPLAKAAQAIRSAARVVHVQLADELSAVITDTLERAAAKSLALSSHQMAALVKAAEFLETIAHTVGPDYPAWLTENTGALDDLARTLSHTEQPTPVTSVESTDQTPPPTPPDEPHDTPPPQHPAASPGSSTTRTTDTKQPEPQSAEQVVRVTAQSLTRLMGLAGESLVEARWLQPFSKSLLELKRQQALLADGLEELRQTLATAEPDEHQQALLAGAVDRLTDCRTMLATQIGEFENRAKNADDLNSRLYHEVIASRMRPFWDGVQGFPRMVRDLARKLEKQVTFNILGETTDVDRDILEKLEAPLNHILRNAVDHGLETPDQRSQAGKRETCLLELEARHNAGMLVITVRDNGRGIDLEKIRRKVVQRKLADERIVRDLSEAELLEFLFLPAFSTAGDVTEVSGRGVGLDVVHSMVHSVGGSVRVHSQLGQGTTFQLQLPITLSVIRAVLVSIAGEPYAFPHNRIDRLVRVPRNELSSLENRQHFDVDGRNVGVVFAHKILDLQNAAAPPADTLSPNTAGGAAGRSNRQAPTTAAPDQRDELFAILFSHHSDQYGLIVDEFCGERDLVVRPLDPRLGKVPNINAAAILDDGSPVLIVDLDDLRRSIERKLQGDSIGRAEERGDHGQAKRILVVDDSITVREVQRQLLVNQGYEVEVAVDGMEGWNTLSHSDFDLVITDIDMPRLNGIDLVRMIKGDPRLLTTPVVIVSYKDREEDRLAGMEAGADYYLTKSSFHDETLLAAVQDLIGEAHP